VFLGFLWRRKHLTTLKRTQGVTRRLKNFQYYKDNLSVVNRIRYVLYKLPGVSVDFLKKLSHGVLSFSFGHVHNLLYMEGNFKIIVYSDRKTSKR